MDRVADFFTGFREDLHVNGLSRFLSDAPNMISAVIKLTNACNSKCIYCQSWQDKPVQTLSIDCLRGVVHDLRQFKRCRAILSGGEPTLSEHLPYIVTLLAKERIPSVVITNGLKIETSAKWIRDINELTFSIDSVCCKTYKHLRGINQLDNVINNLACSIKKSQANGGQPLISVNIVLSRQALKDLLQTVGHLSIMGVKRFYFMQLETHVGIKSDLLPTSNDWNTFWLTIYPKIVTTLFAAEISVPKWVFRAQDELSTKPDNPCLVPWLQAVIRPNGDVYPCCRLGDDGSENCRDMRYRLGNLNDNPFGSIIRGKIARAVRHGILKSPPTPCHNCDFGIICSYGYMVGDEREKMLTSFKNTLDYPEHIKV